MKFPSQVTGLLLTWRLLLSMLLSFLRMSAEMTLTTSLMPDYRYRRIQFILYLHLNTDCDHSRVEKHGDLFCWDSATASFAVWGILTIHWTISSTVLGLRGFYHLQRWHRLSRSVCGLSSNNEQLLLLIFTRADRYPGLRSKWRDLFDVTPVCDGSHIQAH